MNNISIQPTPRKFQTPSKKQSQQNNLQMNVNNNQQLNQPQQYQQQDQVYKQREKIKQQYKNQNNDKNNQVDITKIHLNTSSLNKQIIHKSTNNSQTNSNNSQIASQRLNSILIKNKLINWKIIIILMIITVVISSSLSIGIFFTIIKYQGINFETQILPSQSNQVKKVNQIAGGTSQNTTITSNQFCGNININIQPVHGSVSSGDSNYTYFSFPYELQIFPYNTLSQVIIPFDKAIPKTTKAKYMKLLVFLRTGNEQWTDFWTKTKLVNGEQEYLHWTMGVRYPQNAVSYNCQTIQVPIQSGTRQLRVSSNHIQTNSYAMKYYIVGYRQ